MSQTEDVALELHRALGVDVIAVQRLSGGASRWTSLVDVVDGHGTRRVVLQQRRGRGLSDSDDVTFEAALLRAACVAGVPVPRVVAAGTADDLPEGWLVVDWLDGETIPRRILRNTEFTSARDQLTRQCARALAQIHSLSLDGLPHLPSRDPLAEPLTLLDATREVRPVLELASRWLELTRCPPAGRTVVHGDFRLGNLLVDASGLRGVLDWELAHAGDPTEDLGWLTAPAWRFGGPHEVGGFGNLDDLLREYTLASGRQIDPTSVRWWQGVAALKWAVICALQASAHLSGVTTSVELAVIGRRVCESEWDLLGLMGVGRDGAHDVPSGADDAPAPDAPFGRPTMAELVGAVEGYLTTSMKTNETVAGQFEARVARNALAIVAREMSLGEGAALRHRRRVDLLGFASDADLARAVRAGELDTRLTDVAEVLSGSTADHLRIANPNYLTRE